MKKLLSGSYYIVLLLGVLFVVGSFLFAKNETHFRKGEIAGHQQITPQSITQVDAGLWAGHCEDTCCIPESGRRDPVFLYRRGSR